MSQSLKVLLLEDNVTHAKGVLDELRRAGYAPHARRVDNEKDFIAALDASIDVIITGYHLRGWTGTEALAVVQDSPFDIPVIFVCGTLGDESAAAVMRQGAADYLLKDRLARLGPAVGQAMENRRLRTERRAADSALRLQGAALTAAANGVMITDYEGAILWANPAFCQLTGYSLEEALGRNPRDILKSGQQDPAAYRELWETILSGRVWRGELINRRKDGSVYHEEQTITPVRDRAGKITHFIGIKQDLTARLKAEEALRQSEEHYRLLFENNPLPMWLYDEKTLEFLDVNEAALRQYGYTRAEFQAMSIKDIRPAEDVPELLRAVEEGRAELTRRSERRHRRKDGAIIEVETVSQQLRLDEREARLVLAVDVTERKLLEKKFIQAQRLESIGMLAAGIAHDLNNVLAPIVFAAPLLRDHVTNPRDVKIINTLERSAGRGAALVKQILSFARSASGEFRPVQVKHLARDVIGVIEETFPKSIVLEHLIPSDLWLVHGNPTQIHQVILNLCVNARDAMPEGGTLRVSLQNRRLSTTEANSIAGARPGAWVAIEIADTGTGIPPEVRERIWEPFFTTKDEGRGTGLGLSTVAGLVSSHRGFVDLETELGRGTTFRVFLPGVECETEITPESGAPKPPLGQGELVLVVDDDASIRDILSTILVKHGYRVLHCSDGFEALNFFTTHRSEIALVITDVDMPRLGGFGLARSLLQLRPDVRLIAMSGLSRRENQNSDLSEVRKIAHSFLLKPFRPEVLLDSVHQVLSGSKRSGENGG